MSAHIPIVGLDFVDAFGNRRTSFQLLEDGKAIASVDMKDGKITRMVSTWNADMGRFIADCGRLLANSIPATFPNMPRS